MSARERDFIRGYMCACCSMMNGHGVDTMVSEALEGIGWQKHWNIIDEQDRETLRRHGFNPTPPKKS